MNIVCFSTEAPYDHIPRALDCLRRMGLELRGLAVDANGSEYAVRIEYHERDKYSSLTLLARLERATESELSMPLRDSLRPATTPHRDHQAGRLND